MDTNVYGHKCVGKAENSSPLLDSHVHWLTVSAFFHAYLTMEIFYKTSIMIPIISTEYSVENTSISNEDCIWHKVVWLAMLFRMLNFRSIYSLGYKCKRLETLNSI